MFGKFKYQMQTDISVLCVLEVCNCDSAVMIPLNSRVKRATTGEVYGFQTH